MRRHRSSRRARKSSTQTRHTSGIGFRGLHLEALEPRLALHHQPFPLAFDNIQAFVYVDANGNGRPDAGEARVAGVSITLNVSGSNVLTRETDANGRASFGAHLGDFAPMRITMQPTAEIGDGAPYHHYPVSLPDYVQATTNSFSFQNNRPFRESQIPQDSHSDLNFDTFLSGEGFYFGVQCTVKDLTPISVWETRYPTPPGKPTAQEFEDAKGNYVDTNDLNPILKGALINFQQLVMSQPGTPPTFTISSGYRPESYQAHLFDISTRFNELLNTFGAKGLKAGVSKGAPQLVPDDLPGCTCVELIKKVNAELEIHKPILRRDGKLAVNPPDKSKHRDGLAVDVSITGLTDSKISELAAQAGLYRPLPLNDPVHFELFGTLASIAASFVVHSPVAILVTDPLGRRIGYDPTIRANINEIGSNVSYSGSSSEPQSVNFALGEIIPGNYSISAASTGTGPYTIELETFGEDDGILTTDIIATGNARLGSPVSAIAPINVTKLAVDVLPRLSISDVTVTEMDFGTSSADFTVSLSSPPPGTVTLSYATSDDSALVSGNDYLGVSGTLTFSPSGPLTQTIHVLTNSDTNGEIDETFFVTLKNVTGAILVKSQGMGTIKNDDTAIFAESTRQNEGAAGTTSVDFIVTVSPPSVLAVTVDFTTADGTATLADKDYSLTRGTLTFAPGETTKTVNVVVHGDLKAEKDEALFLNLLNPINAQLPVSMQQGSGTIVDDDSGGTNYYVNDSSTLGDVYSTAVGSNANDGKSPGSPMASLSAFFTKYPGLGPGDTIYVDSGYYNVAKNIALGPSLSGIRIIGPEGGDLVDASTGSEVLASQPVAFWRMGSASEGKILDLTGNGLDLTLNPSAQLGVTGVSNDGALLTDGENIAATAPDSDLLRPATALTIEAWIRPDLDRNLAYGRIVQLGDGRGAGFGFEMLQDILRFRLYKIDGQGGYIDVPVFRGTWSHIAGTYDGSSLRLYVNGSLVGVTNVDSSAQFHGFDINSVVSISSDEYIDGVFRGPAYLGGIDELAIFDRSLTASEIAAHFSGAVYARAVLDRRNSNAGSYVFEMLGADDVMIGNVAVAGAEAGVFAGATADSDRLTLFGVAVHGHKVYGVRGLASNDLWRVVNSHVFGNGGAGYAGEGVAYAGMDGLFQENEMNGNGAGIDAVLSTVAGNVVASNYGIGISAKKVTGNVVSGSDTGIRGSDVRDNDVFGNSIGIIGGRVPSVDVVSNNRVHHNSDTGIYLQGGVATGNVVFGNRIGIGAANLTGGDIRDNYVFANAEAGIEAYGGSTVVGNTVHSNRVGILGRATVYRIYGSPGVNNYPFTGTIDNNVVYANSSAGIVASGAIGARVEGNTVVATTGDALQVTHQDWYFYQGQPEVPAPSRDVKVKNNILQVSAGYGIYVANDSQVGFVSDYNNIYSTAGGQTGYYGASFANLVDWSLELNLDRHSLALDPLFVNATGLDGMLGFVASTGYDGGLDNDFHLRNNSPLIDKGDPAAAYSLEPMPNGGRIDLGAFGNTSEATSQNAKVSVRLPADGLQLFEGWSRSTFQILLMQPPVANVTVQLTADSQVELSDPAVIFGAADWNVPRTITVWAKDDTFVEGVHQGRVTIATSSTDAGFQGLTIAPLTASIEDNDLAASWQNPVNRLDVVPDTVIAPNDVLAVIDYINAFRSGLLPEISFGAAPPPYLDPSGDGFIAPNDALDVIDYINAHPRSSGGQGEGEAAIALGELSAARTTGGYGGLIEGYEAQAIDAALAEASVWWGDLLQAAPGTRLRGRRGR